MEYFLNFFGLFYNSPALAGFASFASILGTGVSIYLLFQANNIKKKLLWVSEVKNYNLNRISNADILIQIKNEITNNKTLDINIISTINVEISKLKINYKSILTPTDKKQLSKVEKNIKKKLDGINLDELCLSLAYFIARYSREEELI